MKRSGTPTGVAGFIFSNFKLGFRLIEHLITLTYTYNEKSCRNIFGYSSLVK